MNRARKICGWHTGTDAEGKFVTLEWRDETGGVIFNAAVPVSLVPDLCVDLEATRASVMKSGGMH
jgi:hypothetical protein